jgi:hypothetical protein
MADNDEVNIPFGVPFIGGSDDPTEIVGIPCDDEMSEEDVDPGI